MNICAPTYDRQSVYLRCGVSDPLEANPNHRHMQSNVILQHLSSFELLKRAPRRPLMQRCSLGCCARIRPSLPGADAFATSHKRLSSPFPSSCHRPWISRHGTTHLPPDHRTPQDDQNYEVAISDSLCGRLHGEPRLSPPTKLWKGHDGAGCPPNARSCQKFQTPVPRFAWSK